MTGPVTKQVLSFVRSNPYLRYVAWFVPGLLLVPGLNRLMPGSYHAAREVAGFFHALSYLHDPFVSLLYHTPEESLSSLHLHGLLSSPFIALGYIEGGRFVSWIAALAAVAAIGFIGYRLFGRVAGFIAPFGLWAQPMFVQEATAFQPETLSIALTMLSVLLLLSFYETGSNRRYHLSIVALVLAITTHLWEAIILLPLVAISLYYGEIKRAVTTTIAGIGTVGVVYFLTHLQPRGGSSLMFYSTFTGGHWKLLFDPNWWLRYYPSGPVVTAAMSNPLQAIKGLTLIVAVLLAIYWGVRFYRRRSLPSLVLFTLFASGLTIPLFLSRGYWGHDYYLWALFAPLALTFGWAIDALVKALRELPHDMSETLPHVFLAIVVLVALVPATAIAEPWNAVGSGPSHSDAADAGEQLRSANIDSPTEIVFVGEHSRQHVYRKSFVSRTLIYSQILVKERHWGEEGPAIANSTSEIGSQEAIVWIKNGSVDLRG